MNQDAQPSTLALDHRERGVAREIHRLLQRAYSEEALLIGADVFPPLDRTVDDILESDTRFVGCRRAGHLVAVCEVCTGDKKLNIDSIAVDPEHFRRGYGKRILEYVLASHPDDDVSVTTADRNYPAVALFKACGFGESSRRMSSEKIALVTLIRPV